MQRLRDKPEDFTYDELCQLLQYLDYSEDNVGKTSGSAVRFIHTKTKHIIRIHKPHPEKTLKRYVIDLVLESLAKEGLI